MPLLPIPDDAMPVVEILRRDVPKPKDLPKPTRNDCWLRFCNGYCPMGLHSEALTPAPMNNSEFPLATDDSRRVFEYFWDNQTDPQAAVDAVWPDKKEIK